MIDGTGDTAAHPQHALDMLDAESGSLRTIALKGVDHYFQGRFDPRAEACDCLPGWILGFGCSVSARRALLVSIKEVRKVSQATESALSGAPAQGRPEILNHLAYVTQGATVDFYTQVMGLPMVSTAIGSEVPSTGDDSPCLDEGSTLAFVYAWTMWLQQDGSQITSPLVDDWHDREDAAARDFDDGIESNNKATQQGKNVSEALLNLITARSADRTDTPVEDASPAPERPV
ncbi:hypothetical protein [Amycolatopsis jiangsuensis]|uniref:Uncharacterized protein n=1 Tax=Amycolatopsis jiangsuensis TaxID=1181879 RepID=A0A840J803_9PSEU|nr:hypothetical protein [Amycolatopsis jiangsuensis]MBB4689594.1 hypothetical protein [Amycolatopsis jiangsuensis]